ncbi:MAG TPA: dTMP kinase [Burkholderiales bacterium]|nr:dTMP kinase [Burkholderiales bacterium]
MRRGRFVTMEGLDGAGKTTQLDVAADALKARGLPLRVTREPGGTPLGEALRGLLLDPAARYAPETETLLMFAARREHIDKVIAPALAEGTWVLCDRFTDASFAYQGGGSGVEWPKLETLEHWVHADLHPDLTIYFDVSPEIGRSRASAIKTPDRFEQERAEFHARVRAAYLERAREHSNRIRVVDAGATVDEVSAAVRAILSGFCEAA